MEREPEGRIVTAIERALHREMVATQRALDVERSRHQQTKTSMACAYETIEIMKRDALAGRLMSATEQLAERMHRMNRETVVDRGIQTWSVMRGEDEKLGLRNWPAKRSEPLAWLDEDLLCEDA